MDEPNASSESGISQFGSGSILINTAIFVAIITTLGVIYQTWSTGKNKVELQELQYEGELIKKAIYTDDPAQSRKHLDLLLKLGLIKNTERKEKLQTYLDKTSTPDLPALNMKTSSLKLVRDGGIHCAEYETGKCEYMVNFQDKSFDNRPESVTYFILECKVKVCDINSILSCVASWDHESSQWLNKYSCSNRLANVKYNEKTGTLWIFHTSMGDKLDDSTSLQIWRQAN